MNEAWKSRKVKVKETTKHDDSKAPVEHHGMGPDGANLEIRKAVGADEWDALDNVKGER